MGKTVLYVYAMTNDSGFAPCVNNNLLTLACCKGGEKGGMRTKAAEDFLHGNDVWIMGLCGKGLAGKDKDKEYSPIYLANITSVSDMISYYSINEYRNREDHKAYRVENGDLIATDFNPHNKEAQEKDKCGKFVLLSNRFVYWGDVCGKEKKELANLIRNEFPGIFITDPRVSSKKGIDKHYRGYIVDRDCVDFSEFINSSILFPSNNSCFIYSQNGISGKTYLYNNQENSEKEIVTCISRCNRI